MRSTVREAFPASCSTKGPCSSIGERRVSVQIRKVRHCAPLQREGPMQAIRRKVPVNQKPRAGERLGVAWSYAPGDSSRISTYRRRILDMAVHCEGSVPVRLFPPRNLVVNRIRKEMRKSSLLGGEVLTAQPSSPSIPIGKAKCH